MADKSSIRIHVGSAYGPPTAIEVSTRARDICPLLHSLASGSSLPTTFITPFRVVLSYLNGDHSVAELTNFRRDTSLLLLFATTWSLAARLHLPDLQNSLVSAMAGIYIQTRQDLLHQYAADAHVDQAFRHLHAEVGRVSHAEELLICFMGRTAPLISALKKQLKLYRFDKDISGKILDAARSFAPDPIKYNVGRFQIDTAHPPQYAPIEIQHALTADGLFQTPLMPQKLKVEGSGRVISAKEQALTVRASYVPPSVESVTSDDSLYGPSPIPMKKPKTWIEPETPFSHPSALTFLGNLPPKKMEYMDRIPIFPAPDLMVFPTAIPNLCGPQSTPMPHISNAAATAVANAALHPPPQSAAAPVAVTVLNVNSQEVTVQPTQEARRERADSTIADAVQPEIHAEAHPDAHPDGHPSHQTQHESQAQAKMQTESEQDTNEDRALQLNLPRLPARSEQIPTPSHTNPPTPRRSWLSRLFRRHERPNTPESRSPPPRRSQPRKSPPPPYSGGGTWAYSRACSHRHDYSQLESGGGGSRGSPPLSPLQPAFDGDAGDDGNGSGSLVPRHRSRERNGRRRDRESCREYKGEAYAASRKKGSRTGFAVLSYNRRRWDE